METLLMIVAGLSMAMSLGSGVLLVKVLREDRRRSAARVAMLAELAGHPAEAGAELDLRESPAAADLDLQATNLAFAVDGGTMFSGRPEPRSWTWGSQSVIVGALASVVLAGGYVLTARSDRSAEPVAAAATAAPLELLSLEHASRDGRLIVSGLVHNPRGAQARVNVLATAIAFDAEGALLAKADAPLDFTTLDSGAESPFVVTVPVRSGVARYRIGFRAGEGQVIAHVDRRTPSEAVARK